MFRGQKDAGQHGHERQRHHHRTGQGEDDRQRHRPEQLPFDSFEREDRQIDDHDDQLAEHRRLADLDGRVADNLQSAPPLLVVRKLPDAVLDHHDGAIDDEAEVDGAQAQEARRDAELQHPGKGKEHRQRDGERHDQPARRLPKKMKRTAMTSRPPSKRFFWTVWITWSTSSVRS